MTTPKTPEPQVSVIMSVFNGERFLAEAIDSVLSQSFSGFEFVIVNDGSTDRTSSILAGYADGRIRLVEREKRGFAPSLNDAIQLSKGRYIARMDADDISLERRLHLQYAYMESHPDTDIVGGQAYTIDGDGRITGEMRKPVSWANIARYINYATPLCHPTFFVRRAVYEVTGGYRTMPPVEDYDFLLRAVEQGFVLANLPDRILKYRLLPSGMSSSNPRRTMTFKAQARRMHRLRTRGARGEDRILSLLRDYNRQTGFWFMLIYRCRNNLLQRRKDRRGLRRYLLLALIVMVSLGDYRILVDTYAGFRSLRWNN
jgi:glycosyltransferase involved in cell wall biosynthesis